MCYSILLEIIIRNGRYPFIVSIDSKISILLFGVEIFDIRFGARRFM